MNIELDEIENELHEYGKIYIPPENFETKKTLEETIAGIMEHDILMMTEIGKKVSEFEGEYLEDARITLKVFLFLFFI